MISNRYSTSMGQHLSPRYGQVILVSGYPVPTPVNWSQHGCAICMQYQSPCAPRLARKCDIKHWFSCSADGWAVYCHVFTNFFKMGRVTYPWCSAGALRAPDLCNKSFHSFPFYSVCYHFTKRYVFVYRSRQSDKSIEMLVREKMWSCCALNLWSSLPRNSRGWFFEF